MEEMCPPSLKTAALNVGLPKKQTCGLIFNTCLDIYCTGLDRFHRGN